MPNNFSKKLRVSSTWAGLGAAAACRRSAWRSARRRVGTGSVRRNSGGRGTGSGTTCARRGPSSGGAAPRIGASSSAKAVRSSKVTGAVPTTPRGYQPSRGGAQTSSPAGSAACAVSIGPASASGASSAAVASFGAWLVSAALRVSSGEPGGGAQAAQAGGASEGAEGVARLKRSVVHGAALGSLLWRGCPQGVARRSGG